MNSMSKFRCPSCEAKNPVVGDDAGGVASKSLKIPVSDQCKKCGTDLREPALESLDREALMARKSIEQVLELKQADRYTRWKGLELRAQLHERLGRSKDADRDRRQAVDELSAQIEKLTGSDDALLHLPPTIEWRAVVHERAGDRTEGARDRLLVADVVAAGAGEVGVETAAAASPLTIALGGPALGLEWASAARAGAASSQLKTATRSRQMLMDEGRAVGVGLCDKCGAVVDVTADGRCPKRHRVELRRYVVPDNADEARARLTRTRQEAGVQ
jgi:hypothetical protein